MQNQRKKQLILEKYPSGFSFEPTARLLVEGKIGEKLDEIDIAEMKQEMFQRHDGVYFFVEQITDAETRQEIINTAENWLSGFGCFSLDALFEKYTEKIKQISNVEDFGTFLEKLHYPLEAYQSAWYNQNKSKMRFTRPVGVKRESVFEKLTLCIKEIIDKKYSAAEYEILEAIPALNSELLLAVIKDKMPQILRSKNNDVTCFQFAENHLPPDLPKKIAWTVEQLEKCGLPITQEALHTALSLLYETNFNETYQLPDMKEFRKLIDDKYEGNDRNWERNVFVRITE